MFEKVDVKHKKIYCLCSLLLKHDVPPESLEEMARILYSVNSSPFTILGTNEGASPEEVKAAYIRSISLVHPDLSGGAVGRLSEEPAKLVNAAYKQICTIPSYAQQS